MPTTHHRRHTRRQVLAAAGLAAYSLGSRTIPTRATSHASLRELAQARGFEIGCLVDPSFLRRPRYQEALAREFNLAVIDGGPLHWGGYGVLRPTRDRYNFALADRVVAFAEDHGMAVEGHHLAWGRPEALPRWLREGNLPPNEVIAILREHVQTVVGHYAGRIHRWSVVNEPFNEDGSYKTGPQYWGWWNDNSPWSDGIDPDYIEIAFREAHAADPEATLILNDWGNEAINPKSNALYFLVARLQQKGVPIHGVGMQMHLWLNVGYPDKFSVIANMQRFKHDLGVSTYVTEMDVSLHGVPGTDEERYRLQAQVYRDMIEACLESGACESVSVFGVSDNHSWLFNHPERNRDADPLLFDRSFEPKPAYDAVRDVLGSA